MILKQGRIHRDTSFKRFRAGHDLCDHGSWNIYHIHHTGFPDLTVDGSFPLGAALSAVLITKGVNPILTLLVTFAAGAFAGMLTGIIHVKLKVRDLLSGIIMMTALYTVNLRIAGRANLPIYNMTTLFDNDFVRNVFKGGLAQFSNVIIILVITLVMKFLLDWYMSTKSGYLLRAVGDNETIVTSMGVDKGITKSSALQSPTAFAA